MQAGTHSAILSKLGKDRQEYMCVKHCKCMGSLYKHIGNAQGGITLILRYESIILVYNLPVLIHSACSYKNYGPKCSQNPHELVST